MRRLRKWFVIVLLGLLVVVVLIGMQVYWQRQLAKAELANALNELDAEKEDWRLEQIEANRRTVPEKENGALIVMAAGRRLPKEFWRSKLADELRKTPPPAQLPEDLVKKVREELKGLDDALVTARTLIDYPQGRFPITYAPDVLSTLVSEQQRAREVATLLQLDAYDRIHNGKWNAAWQSSKALLNVNRSVGDEPLLISALIRMATQGLTIQCIERILAQGAIADDELLTMQTELAHEVDEPLFLRAMRGERAGTHQLMTKLETDDVPIAVAMDGLFSGRPPRPAGWWDRFNDLFARKMVYRSHAWLVRFYSDVMDAAGRPFPEQYEALREIDIVSKEFFAERDNDFILASLLARGVLKVAVEEQRLDTLLHCASTALAVERFRLKFERWPESLDELVQQKFLPAVPMDLFDGDPLRFRRAADGVVIHSVGRDGNYAADALDRLEDFDPQQLRLEFRLWDPARRRQPPLPPRKLPENP